MVACKKGFRAWAPTPLKPSDTLCMEKEIANLLENNRSWAERMCQEDPDYFTRLSQQQNPDYLWIGCSDSRVPANQIISLPPGEVFVHRNVANLLHHNDMNALSVRAVCRRRAEGKAHHGRRPLRLWRGPRGRRRRRVRHGGHWLHSVRELYSHHRGALSSLPLDEQVDRMCELNVRAQVNNLCRTKIVQLAWQRGQDWPSMAGYTALATGESAISPVRYRAWTRWRRSIASIGSSPLPALDRRMSRLSSAPGTTLNWH
jgi:carbonic anhydrase